MSNPTEMLFESLALPEQLQRGVRAAGFTHCTPIQAQTLPLALSGKDVAGQAQTGTGKTAAFVLASFNHLINNASTTEKALRGPRAIMLAPTRELAIQIYEDAKILGSGTEFRCQVVYGGADYEEQRQRLANGVDILIGTPGRFIDYFKQRIFSLKNAQVMVLDISYCQRVTSLVGLQQVRELTAMKTLLQNSDVELLAQQCHSLQKLDLSWCPQITDLTPLSTMDSLSHVWLSYCLGITDVSCLLTRTYPLEYLNIIGCQISKSPSLK